MPRQEFDKALNELQSTIETVQELVERMIIDSIKALETRDLDLANKVAGISTTKAQSPILSPTTRKTQMGFNIGSSIAIRIASKSGTKFNALV